MTVTSVSLQSMQVDDIVANKEAAEEVGDEGFEEAAQYCLTWKKLSCYALRIIVKTAFTVALMSSRGNCSEALP